MEQGGKRRAPSSLQKELSEKPPRNVSRRVPVAKSNKPRSASVESSENFVCERTLYWFAALLSSLKMRCLDSHCHLLTSGILVFLFCKLEKQRNISIMPRKLF